MNSPEPAVNLLVHTSSGQITVLVSRLPDTCPLCHTAIEAVHVWAFLTQPPAPIAVHRVMRCPKEGCHRPFIAIYEPFPSAHPTPGRPSAPGPQQFRFRESLPVAPASQPVPDEIKQISPQFVETYDQALAAEQYGLEQVVGCGLRKALEFLIKDFVQSTVESPEEKQAIQKMWLADCIRDRVDDARIKSCAQRATWLSNDEVHYLRKWGPSDIDSLKTLVRLTINWIHNALLTSQFEKKYPPRPS